MVYIVCLGIFVWRQSRISPTPQEDKEQGSAKAVEEKPVLDISSPPPIPPRSPARRSTLPIPTYIAPMPAPYTTWTPTLQDRRMTGQSVKSLHNSQSISSHSHSSHTHSHHSSYGSDEFGRPLRSSMQSSRFSTMPTPTHASRRPSILPPSHQSSTVLHTRPLSSQPPSRSRPLSNQPTPATEKRRTLPALPPPGAGGGMYNPGWGYGPPAGFQDRQVHGSGSHASFQGSIGVQIFQGPPGYQGQDAVQLSSPRTPTTPTPHYLHASHQSQAPTPYYQKRMTNPNVNYGVAV